MQTMRVCALCAAGCFVLFPTRPAGADPPTPNCFVDVTSTAQDPQGTSWADAYPSLQSAINNANCTAIWVADGTCVPRADPRAHVGVPWIGMIRLVNRISAMTESSSIEGKSAKVLEPDRRRGV